MALYDRPPVPTGAEYREPEAAGFVLPAGLAVDNVLVELTGAGGTPQATG